MWLLSSSSSSSSSYQANVLNDGPQFQVDPLRSELKRLESSAEEKKAKGAKVQTDIAELEASIAAYKDEYAALIAQAEAIKAGLSTVQSKVQMTCFPNAL